MKRVFWGSMVLLCLACKKNDKVVITAQEVVDRSIEVSGGRHYMDHRTSFFFRNKKYVSETKQGEKVLKRISFVDTFSIVDVKTGTSFSRYTNGDRITLPDSIAKRYANSVNSVHYFARLPYGLDDKAVNKEFLGEETIHDRTYYKVKVTFDEDGGGDDFDDVYVYWFHTETFKPDYLAYEFHVNGGGQRFREAYNERYVNGIRFVDYNNYKPKKKGNSIYEIAQLLEDGGLELLSKIELSDVEVVKD